MSITPDVHFKSAFWSQKQPDSTLPDFNTGLSVLYQRLNQSQLETEELIKFFKSRIALETQYATQLAASPAPTLHHQTSLSQAFQDLHRLNQTQSDHHSQLASQLTLQLLLPLEAHHDHYRRHLSQTRQALDRHLKTFEQLTRQAERARAVYHRKAPRPELDRVARQIRHEVMTRDHRSLLGLYRDTSTGQEIATALERHGWLELAHALVPSHLRPIGQARQRFSTSGIYQWRLEDERAGREAMVAEQEYRDVVFRLDKLRMGLEESIFVHLTGLEQVERGRVQKVKDLLEILIGSWSASLPDHQAFLDQLVSIQLSIRPDQDIQAIVRQHAVSSFCPKPIVFDHYYYGILQDQVFGIPLEESGKSEGDKVPKFVSALLQAVEKKIDESQDSQLQQNCWSTPIALDRVHQVCLELNPTPPENINLDLFNPYEPDLLVAVLRYYLLELPDCLLTYDFYDTIDTLLGEKSIDQETSARLTSFSSFIATLPSSHFATLNALISNIVSYIKKYNLTSETIQSIVQSLGPVLLKSRVESYSTLISPTPFLLVQELLEHHDIIFSDTTQQLHEENEKRRLAKPLVVPVRPKSPETLLLGLIRPAEDLNRWAMNSVKGVFQRSSQETVVKPLPSLVVERPVSPVSIVPKEAEDTVEELKDPKEEVVKHDEDELREEKVDVEVVGKPFELAKEIEDGQVAVVKEAEIKEAEIKELEIKDRETKENNEKEKELKAEKEKKPNVQIDSSFFDDDDD